MYTLPLFRELFVHMEWADASVWRLILSSEAAQNDEKAGEILRHLHRTQQYFMKVWRGDAIEYKEIRETISGELGLTRQFYRDLPQFVATLDEASLTGETLLPWSTHFARMVGRDAAAPNTLGESLFQIYSHSMYHRGQLNARLRQLDVEPPLVDYIAWIWLARPAAEWPESGGV